MKGSNAFGAIPYTGPTPPELTEWADRALAKLRQDPELVGRTAATLTKGAFR